MREEPKGGALDARVLDVVAEQFILYRDLKPSNLLLDAEGHARLIDFGISVQIEGARSGGGGVAFQSSDYCGTRGYMAPEIFHSKSPHSTPADWFSCGVLLYELAELDMPFGMQPRFEDLAAEFREPDLLDEQGEDWDQTVTSPNSPSRARGALMRPA